MISIAGIELELIERGQGSPVLYLHGGSGLAMDAPFVPFGQPEPPLQVQVVPGHVAGVAADKQPRREAVHDLTQVLVERGLATAKPLLQAREPPLALGDPTGLRVERRCHQTDFLHLLLDARPDLGHRR